MRIIGLFLTVVLALALFACSGEKKTEEMQKTEPQMEATSAQPDSMAADMAVCASCGMEHKKADMEAYETDEGDTLYFCGENCKKAYLAKMDEEKTTE
jgi:YHS domain-containing protein